MTKRQKELSRLYDELSKLTPDCDAYESILSSISELTKLEYNDAKLDSEIKKAKKEYKAARKAAKKAQKVALMDEKKKAKQHWLDRALDVGLNVAGTGIFIGALNKCGRFEESGVWASKASRMAFDEGRDLIKKLRN